MRQRIRPQDWEALSAYLDGELSPKERARLEARLQASADLRLALDELRRTRAVLRLGGKIRAPRNFTLTPDMLATPTQGQQAFGLFSAMRLTSALATALFLLVLLGDLLTGASLGSRRQMAAMPAAVETLPVQTAIEIPPGAPQAPAIGEKTQAPAEEAMKALEMATTPATEMAISTPEAGITEMLRVAPLPPGAGGGLISPTEEVGVMAMAPVMTPTIETTFTPAPTPSQVVQESAQADVDQAVEAAEAETGGRSLWRILEVSLAVVGLASGLAAYTLRRAGRK